MSSNSVDSSYDMFWSSFKSLFDLHFPLTRTRFNKNLHKISNYMTRGLLVSRKTKLALQKKQIADPSILNKQNYKNYRNLYNKLIRISKKMYVEKGLNSNKKKNKKKLGRF